MLQFIIAVVVLVLVVHINGSAIPVVDVAKEWAPVGTWGPALVNQWTSPWGLPLAGLGSHAPWGAPLITLNQGLNGLGAIGLGIDHIGIGAPLIASGHDG